MAGVARFDCYPSDFLNGVIGLSGDEIAAYTIIMMLQYDRGVPVTYVGREHELSVRSGLPKGRLSKAIENLEGMGKFVRIEGALSIPRTEKELGKISERIRKNSENSLNGGEATKKKWEQLRNENKEGESRSAIQPASASLALLSPPSAIRHPPKEGSVSEDGNGGSLPKPPDPDADLFNRGKAILGKNAGGQIAKLKAMFGGDVARTRAYLEDAAVKNDPGEWVAATIRKHAGKPPPAAGGLDFQRFPANGLYDTSI